MAFYRLALLGDPVEHSRSPQLHRAMLEIAGLEGEYQTVQADEDGLEAAVEALREGHWDGLNITMPLKAAAAGLADSLSPEAARSGSVNTLARIGSEIEGSSTDSSTFQYLVDSEQFRQRSSVLILGAGGTAAAALAAMKWPSNVYVSARRSSAAEDVTGRLGGDVVSWGTAVAGALVINTTPLGMSGEHLPDGILRASAGLIDLPYGSRQTPAIEQARHVGIPHADGHEFLIRQAIASFELWTGSRVGFETVAQAVRNI
jgi:shikimate dehydrogenase